MVEAAFRHFRQYPKFRHQGGPGAAQVVGRPLAIGQAEGGGGLAAPAHALVGTALAAARCPKVGSTSFSNIRRTSVPPSLRRIKSTAAQRSNRSRTVIRDSKAASSAIRACCVATASA